ncbi:MAG: hypothetical protein H7Z16_05115 [Pyrinomonadaceae bacterium]|nr:hypothetical protein [Pyrinomonadaceae bacterium]
MDACVPDYALLFFDHLHSEYLALENTPAKQLVEPLAQSITDKRLNCTLTWSDIYTFDLALVDIRPPESLIRKAYDARARYRNIAGQKEYDEYVASKPPDLSQVPFNAQKELSADIKYLLSKFYLYYSILPIREGLRDDMTGKAVMLTAGVVGIIGFAIVVNVAGTFDLPADGGIVAQFFGGLKKFNAYSVVLVTVLTVTLAGIVGGCVSMLQRIQSAPSEGDALFNMASLQSGSWGIILSPLYGGIFASLLFVLFAAGVLKGSIFPQISTPLQPSVAQPAASPSPTPEPTPSPSPPTNAPEQVQNQGSNPPPTGAPAGSVVNTGQPSPPSPSPAPSPRPPVSDETGILQIKDFLKKTGPADGLSYALLIIWSFIAGFAERLVPDTLNRLVAKNEAIQGTNS